MQQFKLNDVKRVDSRRKRANDWTINFKNLIKHENKLFVFENLTTKEKLICRNHDDSLTEHFNAEKTLKLFQKKYYWSVCEKQIKKYVRFCNVCQRTKVSCHKLYEKLSSLPAFKKSWKKIIMNFVTKLSLNKRRGVVYDSILMIIDRYIKMIKYILIIKKIDVAELTKVFFEKIVLRFDMSDKIVNDRKFVFTNVFWFAICYHARI